MPSLLLRWLATSLSILMLPHLLSGVQVSSLGSALAAATVIAALNFLVRPLIILLTLPLTILTLGFFLLIINALIFQWAGHFVTGFQIDSFGSAFWAALIVSLISWLMNLGIKTRDGKVRIVVKRFRNDNAIDLTRDGDKWR